MQNVTKRQITNAVLTIMQIIAETRNDTVMLSIELTDGRKAEVEAKLITFTGGKNDSN